ncbi:helix-turn-helix domain-containing protein [Rhizobium sp. SL86]|jgi:AraC-like DNA-binding protein|uniref:helix-turn-helix domain-containing protein n=1 Tax=Rhizobium sp. SL86 TaxID=2995148 RepID=UPI0022748512|nr:helix-turn-helix domain-containing protein [Rhizobium sp. SL86]MCY1666620.1 helix-turn-helix domain-containing protein [Rhizobium sp. SL86]
MHLGSLEHCVPTHWVTREFDAWTSDLKSICGRFNPTRYDGSNVVRGCAALSHAAGVELAQVANDLDYIRRDPDDIRADQGDNLFLLLQLEGSCGVEQSGRQEQLHPGECILVDSTRPSVFYFGGSFSNHLSVHLPRQMLLSDRAVRISVTRKIRADDPMSIMLGALVAKMMSTSSDDNRAPHLRELLFNTTRQAFASDPGEEFFVRGDSGTGRLEVVQVLIDENLTEEYLTPQWLANRVGVSLRTLQEDLSSQGMTVTGMIKLKRLHLARARLERLRGAHHPGAIADVAYSVGFNDISYFNRSFRKLFDCSPKDVVMA